MRIKKIEVCGFKSFSDKIEIDFPAGVTAVVGPNGCGKSNVVDAIRWALGEQSPKQLRGKAMEDVIFNGSESRKPQGMAEVLLTFANENGHAVPEYMDFSEICVGRRLFRSGESEYSINKVPCRLKDVTDLFLGTGVGHRAYSIVEQGKMDFVLNAKPEERRILIEEAAGVTKYKDRKAAALRKMEATQQNLLRLSDVIAEIKRQMNSLNRQAKKAERFKGFRQEVRALELGQAAQTCRHLESQKQQMQAALTAIQDSGVRAEADVQEVEASLERIKVNLLDLERDLAAHQQRVTDAEGAIKDRETEIELALKEKENLQKQASRAEEEIGKLVRQNEDSALEIQQYEKVKIDLDRQIEEGSAFLAAKDMALLAAKEEHGTAEKVLSREKNEFVDLLTRQAHLKNHLTDLKRRMEDLSRREAKTAREREEAQRKVEDILSRMGHQSSKLEGCRQTRSQMEEEKAKKTEQARELHARLGQVRQSLAKVRERLHQENSRLNSLLELQRNFEGYQEGVRAILLKRQAQGFQNGIYGLVEDMIETDPVYECVVESVLGERLQHIVVENHEESVKAIDYLKANGSGRSSFIPLHLKPHPLKAVSAPLPEEVAREGGVALLDVVKVKEEYSAIASYLFGDVWVVPTLEQAIKLWNRDSIWKTLVSLDGEVLHPSGVVTGGSKEQIGSGTFHRKREIRDLTQSTKELREELASLEESEARISCALQELEESLSALAQALHRQEIEIVSQTKELDQCQGERKHWLQQMEVLQFEESQLADEQKEIVQQTGETESALQASAIEKGAKEKELARKEEELSGLKRVIEALLGEVTEAKVRLGAWQEKRQSLEQNLQRAKRILQETESLLVRRRQEVEESGQLIAAAEETRCRAEGELHGLLREHQELQAHLAGKKEGLLDEREKLEGHELRWKERREALQKLQGEKNTFSMKLMELDLNLKHLLANIEEKHQLTPEAVFAREDERDYFAPEVEERLQELKGLIESMGEVNLLAIQEYEESKARLEFLTAQESDLVQSLEALDQAIKKINRTTRRRFAETFARVHEKFKEIFATLFGGGRAELILADESNLLETGVDIIAQPPGKKLQNVNLLSGGERALTAVALIFALFLINPSPFCLMDEVDAPLDDVNIGRFNRMLKELSDKYQIILVTHNKSTMELANTLYGVTMEEPGISKLVSVKLT